MVGRNKHRFPNLACMKISGYYKEAGEDVTLECDYNNISKYDKVFISKVFTDTPVPDNVLDKPNVEYGGTGFFYDKAPKLPEEIEHHMPDTHLYDWWVNRNMENGDSRRDYKYYLDYSIGFLTRGCFRHCPFCVNQNYNKCVKHSPVKEFLDETKPKICFLDDNFFACPEWKDIIGDVLDTHKRFQFKQGLDERILTDDRIESMMTWPYDGDFIFAFDNIKDRDVIEKNLKKIRDAYTHKTKRIKFYVLCGYDYDEKYDDEFWPKDIENTFERIRILGKYNAVPYIMRFEKAYEGPYRYLYNSLAGWCNQLPMFTSFTFREFCMCRGMGPGYGKYKRDYKSFLEDGGKKGASWRAMESFTLEHKEIADKYFDTIYVGR